ncbi:hypothetical protein DFH08DRAFT_211822 [Mycena albidolilacea]|uniref:Uncharacterized protein n=1 Tax=Mycena albidolilacea TaxID=1033008 RepID=A0AAD6ZZ16_9AGAR|nr:hypothetical protein DFH08DRAFT_211822 [Mycena albidolilacea]
MQAVDSDLFSHFWTFVKGSLYDCMTGLLLYGILLVLAVIALHLLLSRPEAPGNRYFIAITGTMLFLSTTQAVLQSALVLFEFRLLSEELAGDLDAITQTAWTCQVVLFAQAVVQVTNVLLADALLIYRCYLVWGRNIYPVILPVGMLAACTALGYVSVFEMDIQSHDDHRPFAQVLDVRIPFIITILTNVVLTILIAGRIWWARRELHPVLSEPALTHRYDTAIAMILESGAVYCAAVIVWILASTYCGPESPFTYICTGAVSQLVNIAPTLIIVRVGLGRRGDCEGCKKSDVQAIHMRRVEGFGSIAS